MDSLGGAVRRYLRPGGDASSPVVALRGTDRSLRDHLRPIVDELGARSARAQGLPAEITSASKLSANPDHILYVHADEDRVHGMIKTGTKNLFIRDASGKIHELTGLRCVLDFYVREDMQRKGIGRTLMEAALAAEGLEPWKIAYDRPSPKYIAFLRKHYSLTEFVPQSNNFVVFNDYFDARRGARATDGIPERRLPGGGQGPQPVRHGRRSSASMNPRGSADRGHDDDDDRLGSRAGAAARSGDPRAGDVDEINRRFMSSTYSGGSPGTRSDSRVSRAGRDRDRSDAGARHGAGGAGAGAPWATGGGAGGGGSFGASAGRGANRPPAYGRRSVSPSEVPSHAESRGHRVDRDGRGGLNATVPATNPARDHAASGRSRGVIATGVSTRGSAGVVSASSLREIESLKQSLRDTEDSLDALKAQNHGRENRSGSGFGRTTPSSTAPQASRPYQMRRPF